jgi:Mn-dependent DtxR family transcriptional regulator
MHKTRGRPKGVTDYALEDYERVFRLVSDRTGRRPQLHEVADELRQHRRTVTDNLKRWGFRDYRDFAAQVMREA